MQKPTTPRRRPTPRAVPYVKEDNSIDIPCVKSTVAEVYENILADLETALSLNSLPNSRTTRCASARRSPMP